MKMGLVMDKTDLEAEFRQKTYEILLSVVDRKGANLKYWPFEFIRRFASSVGRAHPF